MTLDGQKELLGLYLSENEGANYWLSVLTDLHNRGVTDILIACIDGLVVLCHKPFMVDLKPVYRAETKAIAEDALDVLESH